MIEVHHNKVSICPEGAWFIFDYIDLTIAMFEFIKKNRPLDEDPEEFLRGLFEQAMRGESGVGKQPEILLYDVERYKAEFGIGKEYDKHGIYKVYGQEEGEKWLK